MTTQLVIHRKEEKWKKSNKSAKRLKWSEKTARQKAIVLGSIIGCFLGAGLIAYASSTFFTHDSFVIDNTKGTVFSIDLSGSVAGIEVVPGTEQSVAPSIHNTGTDPMYVFIRFDVEPTASGGNVYSFTPDENSGWTAVDTGDAGELLFVYGSSSTPVAIESQDSAEIPGTLTCIASGSDFVALDDVSVRVTGCAIGSVGEDGETAAEVYADYIELGGGVNRLLHLNSI